MFIAASLMKTWYQIIMSIDNGIYYIVDYVYQLFFVIGTVSIFNIEDFEQIVSKIYIILGVVVLFMLSYYMLKNIIDPEAKDSNENTGKVILNVVTSVIIVVLLPAIFTLMHNVQNVVLNNDFLGKVILNSGSETTSVEYSDEHIHKIAGRKFALNIRAPFILPDPDWCAENDKSEVRDSKSCGDYVKTAKPIMINKHECTIYTSEELDDMPVNVESCGTALESSTLNGVNKAIEEGKISFSAYRNFVDNIDKGQINYMPIFSILVGIFLLYVIASFCFDLGIRVVKLAFLQLIAPIAVFARVAPGKAKEIFSAWLKKLVSTYLDVFVRIMIMYLGIVMLNLILKAMFNIESTSTDSWFLILLLKAFIIMGLVAFIRMAPKFLSEIFPFMDSESMKLGLAEKFKAGGGFMAAGAARTTASLASRGLYKGLRSVMYGTVDAIKPGATKEDRRKGWGKVLGGTFQTLWTPVSAATGFMTGAYASKDAENLTQATIASKTTVSKSESVGAAVVRTITDIKNLPSNVVTGATRVFAEWFNAPGSANELEKLNEGLKAVADMGKNYTQGLANNNDMLKGLTQTLARLEQGPADVGPGGDIITATRENLIEQKKVKDEIKRITEEISSIGSSKETESQKIAKLVSSNFASDEEEAKRLLATHVHLQQTFEVQTEQIRNSSSVANELFDDVKNTKNLFTALENNKKQTYAQAEKMGVHAARLNKSLTGIDKTQKKK